MTHEMMVLRRAYEAWMGGSSLRSSRERNKRFTFGDQWGDITLTHNGDAVTDWERFARAGTTPVTNNLIPRIRPSHSGGLGLSYIREQYNERSDKGVEILQTEESYTVKLPLL